jgi:regulator of sigma E protease
MIIVWFLILIGPLVFVHELGHFAFAKIFGVKVLRFSLGFGPAIKGLKWKWGETEYQIAYFPLGGYVKMLGEDPTAEVPKEDEGRAFHQRPLWQRYLVVVAGPLFNVVFPVLIYFFYFVAQSTAAPAVVGTVLDGEPADEAGFRPGDRVVAVDGERVRYWFDLTRKVRERPDEKVDFEIERDGETMTIAARPRLRRQETRLGVVEEIGLLGVVPAFTLSQTGVSDPQSPAAKAGLELGDWVVAVGRKPTRYWHELRGHLTGLDPRKTESLDLTVLRPVKPNEGAFTDLRIFRPIGRTVHVMLPADEGGGDDDEQQEKKLRTGMLPATTFVDWVEPGSPAHRLGLQRGDRIVEVRHKDVTSWLLLRSTLRRHKDEPVRIAWKPPGKPIRTGRVQLEKQVITDDFQQEQAIYVFGATNRIERRYIEEVPIHNRFLYAGRMCVLMTGEIIYDMGLAVVQIFRGHVPADTVGGPIMIANIAQVAASKGWEVFLWIMALISLNLALINLLPIPILDGGHVLIFTIEAIRRKPLSMQARIYITYVGLAFLVALMILAFRNDIVRYFLN